MQRASVMITQLLHGTISGGEGDHAENGSVAVKRSFIAVGRRKCYRLHCPGCGHHSTLPGPGPAPGTESGSFQHNTNNYKVKTTCKLSRTLNTLSGAQLQLFQLYHNQIQSQNIRKRNMYTYSPPYIMHQQYCV